MAKQSGFNEIIRYVTEEREFSVAALQERFGLGYPSAMQMLSRLYHMGVIGTYKDENHIKALITLEDYYGGIVYASKKEKP